MRTTTRFAGLFLCVLVCAGCHTTYRAHEVPAKEMAREGGVMFVRPDRYTILGTRSIRDYIEITYERLAYNEAGLPIMQIGLRNRGGQHFWDLKGPEVVLSAKTCFYRDPIQPSGPTGPPVYETNWQTIHLNRGETEHFQVVCPYPDAGHYQLTLSELIR